jgi:hypothetical protein
MHIALLVPEYLAWHYTEAVRLWLNIVSNFLWFTYHFFSMPVMLRRFTKPVAGQPLTTLVNMAGRIIVLALGMVFCCGIVVVGALLAVFWLFLPVITVASCVQAFVFLFKFLHV